ncbi:unnamed protein product [Adineta ricciae]|uniref:Uncharacterized protein n=1 Tax=Adineta ricciae TaxID=249248 RepID=A0A815Z7F8_ADIRI|nr:unnamed protein product [Adineta ricciae]CAF1580357.1 unnamed protein product [Adineta ricciae]
MKRSKLNKEETTAKRVDNHVCIPSGLGHLRVYKYVHARIPEQHIFLRDDIIFPIFTKPAIMVARSIVYAMLFTLSLTVLIDPLRAISVSNKDNNDVANAINILHDHQFTNKRGSDMNEVDPGEFYSLLLGKRRLPSESILLGKRRLPSESILLGKRRLPSESILLGKRRLPDEAVLLG